MWESLALIGKGVRFPAGKWIRVASEAALVWQVEAMLRDVFPALKGKVIATATLMNEFDVAEIEKSQPEPA